MSIFAVGLAKSGTTGLYNTIKTGVRARPETWYCLFEPARRSQLVSLRRFAPQLPVLTKLMLAQTPKVSPDYADFAYRVAIVRDPRDIVISTMLFRPLIQRWDDAVVDRFLDALRVKEADPSAVSVVELGALADELGMGHSGWSLRVEQMSDLRQLVTDQSMFLLRYEDFVDGDLSALGAYLGLELAAGAAEGGSWLGHISRSRAHGEWRRWFTPADVAYFRPLFGPAMADFGYDDDWDLDSVDSLDPSRGSNHIESKRSIRTSQLEMRFAGGHKPKDATPDEVLLLTERADDGDAVSAFRLSRHLSERKGSTDMDATAARHWAYWGAVQGHLPSMRRYATMLRKGDGGAHSPDMARQWDERGERMAARQATRSAARGN